VSGARGATPRNSDVHYRPDRSCGPGRARWRGGGRTLASTETPEVAGGTAGRQSRASSLHRAAQALLDAWDKLAVADSDAADALHEPIAGLRAAVTTTFAAAEPSRPPKATKQSQVPAMLSRTVVLRQS
jgi:hypothetical protein